MKASKCAICLGIACKNVVVALLVIVNFSMIIPMTARIVCVDNDGIHTNAEKMADPSTCPGVICDAVGGFSGIPRKLTTRWTRDTDELRVSMGTIGIKSLILTNGDDR